MKRIVLYVAVLAMIISFSAFSFNAATSSGSITVDSVTCNPGEEVLVSINIASNPGICSARLEVHYDSGLTIVSVKDEGLLKDYLGSSSLSKNPYIVSWDDSTASADTVSTGKLVTFKFKTPSDEKGGTFKVWVTFNSDDVFNLNFKNVSFTTKEGVITVNDVSVPPTEQPTEAPTEKPTEKPTETPTEKPTEKSTEAPTEKPTEKPTENPTEKPTEKSTEAPSEKSTEAPTEKSTENIDNPTEVSTDDPSVTPSENPTESSSDNPSENPSESGTEQASGNPSENPSDGPSEIETVIGTENPTENPSEKVTDGQTTESPTQGNNEPKDNNGIPDNLILYILIGVGVAAVIAVVIILLVRKRGAK